MLVFYPVIAVLHVLSCVSETLGRFLPIVNVAVHIAAFAVFVLAGAELEDKRLKTSGLGARKRRQFSWRLMAKPPPGAIVIGRMLSEVTVSL